MGSINRKIQRDKKVWKVVALLTVGKEKLRCLPFMTVEGKARNCHIYACPDMVLLKTALKRSAVGFNKGQGFSCFKLKKTAEFYATLILQNTQSMHVEVIPLLIPKGSLYRCGKIADNYIGAGMSAIQTSDSFILVIRGDDESLSLLETNLTQSEAFFHKKAGLALGKRVEILHLHLNSKGYGTLRPVVRDEEAVLKTKEELLCAKPAIKTMEVPR
jgi:hypothetical protein